jgi:hypothetical protein
VPKFGGQSVIAAISEVFNWSSKCQFVVAVHHFYDALVNMLNLVWAFQPGPNLLPFVITTRHLQHQAAIHHH